MDYGLSGFSVHGISQARILEWVVVSSSRDLPTLRLKPQFLHWQAAGATREVKGGLRKGKSLSCVQLFATPWTIQSMEFSKPEYWSGSIFLLQGSSQPRD